MESYYVCNGNLEGQDTEIDTKDNIFVIEEPFESYNDDRFQDEPLQLEADIVQESHNLDEKKTDLGKRNFREWNQYETKILMDMYKRNVTQVGPMKKFKSKREMFKCIAQTISTKLNITRNAHQCENRYKTVVNQQKDGRTILPKTRSNVGKGIIFDDGLTQSDVTASVSADHDYESADYGQNSGPNGQSAMKSMNEWGTDDTKLLMDLYRKNISKVGLERTYRTKLKMFEHIANVISSVFNITRTAEQCLNRYKTIFRRKSCKLNKLNNNMSINNTNIEDNINNDINVNCFTPMDNSLYDPDLNTHIYNGRTWLKKVVKQPKTMPKLLPKADPDTSENSILANTLKEIAAQNEKTLLLIAANQERAEERRHQETMALFRHIGENIIQCIGNRQRDTSEQHF